VNLESIATDGRPTPLDPIEQLIALSRRFGADPEFARAGGGNSSVKVSGILYIKPSGAALAEVTAESLIALDVSRLLALLDAPSDEADAGSASVLRAALAARVDGADVRRPSVETLFHALLPGRFVLHTHPTTVNAVTCSLRGRELAGELFGDAILWIPYTDPGIPLARAIRDRLGEYQDRTAGRSPHAILLQNHGLVVDDDTIEGIEATSAWVVDTIRGRCGDRSISSGEPTLEPDEALAALRVVGPTLRAALADGDRLKVVVFDDGPLGRLATDPRTGTDLIRGGPLTPDQIVYAGSWPLVLDPIESEAPAELAARVAMSVARHERQTGGKPSVIVAPPLGLFTAADTAHQAVTVRDVHLDAIRVALGAEQLGGVRPLAQNEREFIERWEAEAYRRRVASGASGDGRARGLIALVTGAAQGFGLAIAEGLAAQGAHVVLADLNAGQAEREATALAARFGPGRAVGLAVDVTDDASVGACFDEVVRRFGGLDLLVSNAGILRAGSVTSQPVEEFDAVTRVNYRGYFLCVRHAAPILARQHAVRPDYWGDIVEINSKSGLQGSGRNSAYSGSKFGGVGLTQSFALELVGDGIKVNAICPGNYLDGPLWSDPEDGLFVQYLREGKVPGATTVEDVRRFYEAKVPMGRGCTPADVLEALYYVIAQRYETGQAIPVTGGQVMLS
jgi:NAD(P)-dependent dehydrogenase (short-subunit alcohol dehydrogenase family)/rhamnose utilization protein RhaD (predicted bifunctional aldolase and dehydrogenase)